MRYRDVSDVSDILSDFSQVVRFVGERNYTQLLMDIGKRLNHKGFVTQSEDKRFSLELELLNLDLHRRKHRRNPKSLPQQCHEGTDFLIGLGQTIPHLSEKGRKKILGQIVGGLRTQGLRSLQHELRVAAQLSNLGYDIVFSDSEVDGGADILATKDGTVYEVEAKAFSIHTGDPIPPDDAEKFFVQLRRGFGGLSDMSEIPIINVVVPGRLDCQREKLSELVEACSSVAASRAAVLTTMGIEVNLVGSIPNAPAARIAQAVHFDAQTQPVHVFASHRHPKVIVRLRSSGRSRFIEKVISTISQSAKRQFSKRRPGIIWSHINFIEPNQFDLMSGQVTRNSPLFNRVADSVLLSPKRNHIIQLVFTGSAYFLRQGDRGRSSYRAAVYNTPHSKFDVDPLFPGGRCRRSDDQLMNGK